MNAAQAIVSAESLSYAFAVAKGDDDLARTRKTAAKRCAELHPHALVTIDTTGAPDLEVVETVLDYALDQLCVMFEGDHLPDWWESAGDEDRDEALHYFASMFEALGVLR